MRSFLVAALCAALAPAALAGSKPKKPPASSPPVHSPELLEPLVPAAPAPAKPAPTPPPVVAKQEAPTPSAPWLHVGVRAGMATPLQFLGPGWEAGLQARLPVPGLGGKLSAGVFLGAQQAAGKGTAIIPGRGYDPGFIQNRLAGRLEVFGEYALWSMGPHALSVALGYGGYLVRDSFVSLGAATTESGLGHALNAGAIYRLAAGPGQLGVHLGGGFGGAALGTLSTYGTRSLSTLSLTLSYELSIPSEEKNR